jgi:hypothetical protein
MPTIAMAISSSISVKPRSRARQAWSGMFME